MKRLQGPEIKLKKPKVPDFLVDLYYDLDERHLLPVVAVLIIGIVAVPLLLSGSSDSEVEAGDEAGASASVAPTARESALTVAKATPSLRDYHKRLAHLHAKDPFEPRFNGNGAGAGAGAGATSSTESSGTDVTIVPSETETAPSEPPSGSDEGDPGGTSTGSQHPELTYYSYAIGVRVVPVTSAEGKPSNAEPSVRHDLPPLVTLPSRDTPALTYLGPSHDGKKAIMLVSENVTSLFGDSKCVQGSERCQLLALEEGAPETVVYGAQGRSFRIELLKIQLEASDHLNRAALGNPKGSGRTRAPHGRAELAAAR